MFQYRNSLLYPKCRGGNAPPATMFWAWPRLVFVALVSIAHILAIPVSIRLQQRQCNYPINWVCSHELLPLQFLTDLALLILISLLALTSIPILKIYRYIISLLQSNQYTRHYDTSAGNSRPGTSSKTSAVKYIVQLLPPPPVHPRTPITQWLPGKSICRRNCSC